MPSFWTFDYKSYTTLVAYDEAFNAKFRGIDKLDFIIRKSNECKYVRLYRACQVSKGTVWYFFLMKSLHSKSYRYGINLFSNLNIGNGLIIGHAGNIIVGGGSVIKGDIFIGNGVNISRCSKGPNKGYPTIEKNVCLRTNAVVMGRITIGEDVVINPNSFVDSDIPSHSVVNSAKCLIMNDVNATKDILR